MYVNAVCTYKDTLKSVAGCDSIVTLTLNVNSRLVSSQTIAICNSQLPYTWNGIKLNAAGTYKDTLKSVAGCDSIVTLTLNVNSRLVSSQTIAICNSQLPYTWNGIKLNAAGTYKDTLKSVAGCDSIVTLTLNVNSRLVSSQTIAICNSQLPYTWNGIKLNAAGTYKDTLKSVAGCDSIVTLTLNVNSRLVSSQTIAICNSQLPYTWNGIKLNAAGTYKDTLKSVAGCDSIVTLTLNVNSRLVSSQTIAICNSQLPYTWNGIKLNAAGTYKDTLKTVAGCDSIVTLTLNVNATLTSSQTIAICSGQLPYTWNGIKLNAAGTYKDTLKTVAGCDSIVTLTLNVNATLTSSQAINICNNQLPYTSNDINLNTARPYKDTLKTLAD